MKNFLKKLPPNLRKTVFIVFLISLGLIAMDTFSPDEITDLSQTLNSEQEQKQEIESFEEREHLVNRVIDGDTIVIEDDIRVRLICVDAPEQGECYYQEAKDALTQLVEGKYVTIEKDVEGLDSYGRLLRYVFVVEESSILNNTFVNKYMIEKGYAGLLPKNINRDYWGILEYARNEARRQNIGVWAVCDRQQQSTNTHPQEADDQPTDPNCVIKGNISKDGYGKTYFTVGCANYIRTKIDFSKGEAYFCTEQQAQAAGFTKATSCR
ncbi:thermonuclease family protein [Patescibacteria group bacterium]|nr:thermonuclease family protein [Patescibacteria group bacterium]